MSEKLPVPRVEVVTGLDDYHFVYLQANRFMATTAGVWDEKPVAVSYAERWADATGWPLVIDGKVVE